MNFPTFFPSEPHEPSYLIKSVVYEHVFGFGSSCTRSVWEEKESEPVSSGCCRVSADDWGVWILQVDKQDRNATAVGAYQMEVETAALVCVSLSRIYLLIPSHPPYQTSASTFSIQPATCILSGHTNRVPTSLVLVPIQPKSRKCSIPCSKRHQCKL